MGDAKNAALGAEMGLWARGMAAIGRPGLRGFYPKRTL